MRSSMEDASFWTSSWIISVSYESKKCEEEMGLSEGLRIFDDDDDNKDEEDANDFALAALF